MKAKNFSKIIKTNKAIQFINRGEMNMMIDAHMHLVRHKNFDVKTYNWLGFPVPNDTDLDDLIRWEKEAGFTKMVSMGQAMDRIWNTNFSNGYVNEAYERYPDFIIPFAEIEPVDKAGRFNQPAYDEFERAIHEDHIRGALFTPPYGHYNANDRFVYPFYQLAQKHGIVVQYHHSAMGGPAVFAQTKYANMFNLNDVIVDFPNMKIEVEHLGYPWTEHLLSLMANCPNMYTDLAMLYNRPHQIAWALVQAREYGVLNRVMFASDFVGVSYDLFSDSVVETLKKWVDLVRYGLNEVNEKCGWPLLTQEEIDGILGNNAARLYGLEEG